MSTSNSDSERGASTDEPKAFWEEFLDLVGDRPFVFWTCFNGCRGTVTWSNNCTEAVCGDCGALRSQDPRIAAILAEQVAEPPKEATQ